MRRITTLMLVVATAVAVALPLAASANHGLPHGGSASRLQAM
jgi:hypothetical protein